MARETKKILSRVVFVRGRCDHDDYFYRVYVDGKRVDVDTNFGRHHGSMNLLKALGVPFEVKPADENWLREEIIRSKGFLPEKLSEVIFE